VMEGPTFNQFNWADSHAALNDPSLLMWLSREFNETKYAAAARWHLERVTDGATSASALMFWDTRGKEADIETAFPKVR
jgi:hypothetical protein